MLVAFSLLFLLNRSSKVLRCEQRRAQVDARGAAIVTAAAILANLFESFLGATVQGRIRWLSNDVVNSIQITLAAYVALFLVDL